MSAVRPMISRSAVCAAQLTALRVVLHFERGLLRIVHHPEEHGIDVDRNRVGRERLFGREAGRDRALIDPLRDRVDERE